MNYYYGQPCPFCGARKMQLCRTKDGKARNRPHKTRPGTAFPGYGTRGQQPKRTMSVMKGLKAMAEMAGTLDLSSSTAFGRSTRRNVAQAIEWIERIDKFDRGESVPASPPTETADCVGDT